MHTDRSEGAPKVKVEILNLLQISLAHRLVLDDKEACVETSKVPRLPRRHHCHHIQAVPCLQGKGSEPIFENAPFRPNFVAEYRHASFATQGRNGSQFLNVPHATARVVRVAQDKHFAALQVCPQTLGVEHKSASRVVHLVNLQPAPCAFRDLQQLREERHHGQHLVTRSRVGPEDGGTGADRAGAEDEGVCVDLPGVLLPQPLAYRAPHLLGLDRVPEGRVFEPLAHCIDDLRTNRQTHVGDPEGYALIGPIAEENIPQSMFHGEYWAPVTHGSVEMFDANLVLLQWQLREHTVGFGTSRRRSDCFLTLTASVVPSASVVP